MARRLRSPVGAAAKVRPAFNRVHASSKPTPAATQPLGFARRVLRRPGPPERLPARLAGGGRLRPARPAATRPSAATVNAAARPQRRNDDPLMATPVPAAADAGAAEPAYSDLPARSRQAPARPPVPPSSPRAHTLRRIALALAAILGLWAAIAAATGGVTLDLGGLRLSSRAALAAGGDRPRTPRRSPCGVPAPTSAGGCWTTRAPRLDRTRRGGRRPARRRAAGGVGGLRRARRRRRRQQRLPEPVAAVGAGAASRSLPRSSSTRPGPQRGRFVAPLGYRASVRADELGPTYAPGLPWLMALAAAMLRRRRPLHLDADRGGAVRVGHLPARRRPRRRRQWRWPRR